MQHTLLCFRYSPLSRYNKKRKSFDAFKDLQGSYTLTRSIQQRCCSQESEIRAPTDKGMILEPTEINAVFIWVMEG